MRAALDDPLPDSDELLLAAGIDRVLPRAVLAGDLADPDVYPYPHERALDDARDLAKAFVRARPGVARGSRPRQRDRLLVKDSSAPTRKPFDRGKPSAARGAYGLGVALAVEILPAEREHRPGTGEPDRLGQLAGRDALEDRVGERRVVGGPIGKACADDLNN
jgi:hypothetical protein